jgi:hypothetical protein
MVYSSKNRLDMRLFDKDYIDNIYNYFDKMITMSSFDYSQFNNLVNLRMHNILNSDRIVETQLTAEEIEKRVLQDYTDFMEVG